MKTKQRLVSADSRLTLSGFANAKSKPRFNPADIRKKHEQFENAKKIKKYRKLTKQIQSQESSGIEEESATPHAKEGVSAMSSNNRRRSQGRHNTWFAKGRHESRKGKNTLEVLRQEYLQRKEEEDKAKAERLEALKAKEEGRSKALQMRKTLKAQMLKRTSSGQPLMKHRLHHILNAIENC